MTSVITRHVFIPLSFPKDVDVFVVTQLAGSYYWRDNDILTTVLLKLQTVEIGDSHNGTAEASNRRDMRFSQRYC